MHGSLPHLPRAIGGDGHGHPLTGANCETAVRLGSAIAQLCHWRLGARAVADRLAAEAPGLVMAHVLRATHCLLAAEAAAEPDLAAALATARAFATGASVRERLHMAALAKWRDRDFLAAAEAYSELTGQYPRDLLALFAGHHANRLTGRRAALRDDIVAALPAWTPEMPGYGCLLGMLAYGRAENGGHFRAEVHGREAVARCPADAWAVGAVADCLDREGRGADAIAWLVATADDWTVGSSLSRHLWAQLAALHLASGDGAAVMAILDSYVLPPAGASTQAGAPATALVDATGLLWRLRLAGHDLTARFAAVADGWDAALSVSPAASYFVWNDLHAAMARVGAGRVAAADRHLAVLAGRAAASHGRVVAEVAVPLVRAIYAFGRGDFALAAELIGRHRAQAHRLGGGQGQLEFLDRTLVAARRAVPGVAATAATFTGQTLLGRLAA